MEDPLSSPDINNPSPSNNAAKNDYDDYLVSDILYVGDLPSSIRETDIKTLLQHCMPVEMYIKRKDDLVQDDEDSYLRFTSPKYADRAYTLYRGFKFTNGATLQLRMYRTSSLEPKAFGDILEVSNLAVETNDIHRLYDLFRPFGPLQLCTSTGPATAMVQYFNQTDSKTAIYETDGMLLDGKRITITQLISEQDGTPALDDTPPPSSTFLPVDDQNLQPSQHQIQHRYQEQQVLTSTSKSHVDLMNLYVKNMDPLITNDELATLFSKFGRIISARVISNPATQQSRGYGFVSFSREDEAAHALNEMNGQMVYSKPLYISYHEPKKGRNNNGGNNNNSNNDNNANSHNHVEYYHTPSNHALQSNISSTHQPQQNHHYNAHPTINLPKKQTPVSDYAHPSTVMIEEMNPFKDTATIKLPPKKVSATAANLSPAKPIPIPSNACGPTLVSLATGLSIDSAPQLVSKFPNEQPPMEPVSKSDSNKYTTSAALRGSTIRRRSSNGSMNSTMTDTSASIQRQKLTNAIIRSHCCNDEERIPDIVDLLLSLTRKERSLCLFNAEFLREKVNLALDSLDTFDDEDDNDDFIGSNTANDRIETSDGNDWVRQQQQQQQQQQQYQQQYVYETASPLPHSHKPMTAIQPSLVAVGKHTSQSHTNDSRLPLTPPSSSLSNSEHMAPTEIDALLKSIAPMSLHTQKQKLGDIMWNYVKPLAKPLAKAHKVPGFSSKVLVHLLDNVPLAELAHGINNTAWLKAQVENAANIIHRS